MKIRSVANGVPPRKKYSALYDAALALPAGGVLEVDFDGNEDSCGLAYRAFKQWKRRDGQSALAISKRGAELYVERAADG